MTQKVVVSKASKGAKASSSGVEETLKKIRAYKKSVVSNEQSARHFLIELGVLTRSGKVKELTNG